MKTTLDGAGAPHSPLSMSRHERREEREAPDDLWALALTNLLVAELPKFADSPPDAGARLAPPAGDDPRPTLGHTPQLEGSNAAEGTGARTAAGRGRADPEIPASLSAEVSDERLGRMQLHIERVEGGLGIVINVADARVKALIEAEQPQLMKTLKDAGLRVASVQIGSPSLLGTALAQRREGPQVRTGASFRQPAARWRTLVGPPATQEDADGEGVDLTA